MLAQRWERAPVHIKETWSGKIRSHIKGIVVEFLPDRIASVKVASLLKETGYQFTHFSDSEKFISAMRTSSPQIAILANTISSGKPQDYRTDLDSARFLHEQCPGCKILFIINRHIELETCRQAISYGVCGFINIDEPDFAELLSEQVDQLVCRIQEEQTQDVMARSPAILDQTGIATQSPAMYKLLGQVYKASCVCDAPIIVEGESGTGKQLLAEAIHKMDGKRSKRPFLSVNCAAITGTLAESELFGHKKGAFTGATEDRPGYFRSADGGTLVLDEISELQSSLQSKLLRVLQEERVLPVGDDKEHPVDVRIIALTNKPLAQEVAEGRFRLDLYQRLNVIKLHIPPLRERLEDIPLLVQYFLKKYKHYYGQPIRSVDPLVYAVLRDAVGKGNIRELENIIRQSLVFKAGGSVFSVMDLPEHVRFAMKSGSGSDYIPSELATYIMQQLSSGKLDFDRLMEQFEQHVLETAMKKLGLRGTRLADHLQMNRRTLYNKLRKYNLMDSDKNSL